jgi:sugar (pentulose or hexulose) kinase
MYPQYWAWRLSGVCVSEVSSLGCHTDLWAPRRRDWSSLVDREGWRPLFPALVPAWETIGTLSAAIAERTGLPATCRVHAGVHDSNASLLRFLRAMPGKEFCVVSSGTWVIAMSTGDAVDALDEARDMLANVSVDGRLVPCIRFMGGREYAEICRQCGVPPDAPVGEAEVAAVIASDACALPDFSGGSGPYGGRVSEIRGDCSGPKGNALATLYCALMVDRCLDLLRVESDVLIAGSFLQNPLLCALIAQLRAPQPVLLSSDTAGTVRGTAQLTNWSRPVTVSLVHCKPAAVTGLGDYRQAWRKRTEEGN